MNWKYSSPPRVVVSSLLRLHQSSSLLILPLVESPVDEENDDDVPLVVTELEG